MTADLISRGIAACKENDFEKGVKLFTKALETGEFQTEALYNRARAFAKLDKQKESLSDFAKLKELNPVNASYIGDYAVSLHLNNENDKAGKEFELALSLEPENPYRHSSMAFFKDRIGDFEGAVAAYEKAIELDPEDAIALNNKGLIEEKLGRKQKSIESFNKSNKLVGYEPEKKDLTKEVPSISDSSSNSSTQDSPNPQTMTEVVKSLLTKEGFNDFMRFTKDIFKKKKD